ncbi:MoaF-related domain-containing protein [Chryseobacterium gambrini]|uniref:MoaF-related domain-containing protein n=1 Tax=Chryseobacterium gambrini TaxID=373672 RepID=UPI0022F17370|nr:hypothetical protein [Chryseobacterium gambrini]WBV52131.1 hypothetical protein PFY09_17720 [Chryseobacterium gambrini]
MKKTIFSLTAAIILLSCNQKNENLPQQNLSTNSDLLGKKAVITFPEMKAEVIYHKDSTLHWKTTDKKGVVNEGDEKMDYQKLSENLHFLNWIEKDGWTVSQIVDTKAGTVKAFWSFADESSTRGKRKSLFVDGKIEVVK